MRNKLYSALGRTMAAAEAGRRPAISPGATARYKDDKLGKTKMFTCLCKFVQDTSCAPTTATSHFRIQAEAYDESLHSWHSKHELMFLEKITSSRQVLYTSRI